MDFADNLGVNFFIIALIRLIKSLKVESYLFSLESNSSELGLVTKLQLHLRSYLLEFVSSIRWIASRNYQKHSEFRGDSRVFQRFSNCQSNRESELPLNWQQNRVIGCARKEHRNSARKIATSSNKLPGVNLSYFKLLMLKIELNRTAVSMIRLIKLRVSFRFFEKQLVGYRWQGLYTQKIRTNRTNQNGQQLPAFFRLCRKQHIVVQKNFWSNTAQANHDR